MTHTRYVLGVDPGKKTGLALFDTANPDAPPAVWEAAWHESMESVVEYAGQYLSDLTIVCEKFIITVATAKHSAAPWSIRGEGVCEWAAKHYGCELVEQTSSVAKTFSYDQRLKDLGWWRPGMVHGMDATRHLLLHLVSRGWWREGIVI